MMNSKKLTIMATILLMMTTRVYGQKGDWLSNVPTTVSTTPTYTADWNFIERMQNKANSQYQEREHLQNEQAVEDQNTLISHSHTFSSWNRSTQHWDESPKMTNAVSFMFLKAGIAYTEVIPGSEPYTNLFTILGVDTTADNREINLARWYAQDGNKHSRYKITYVVNKLQSNQLIVFQHFDNTGTEYERVSFGIDR